MSAASALTQQSWREFSRLLDEALDLPAEQRVLDMGCGTGVAARTLATSAGVMKLAVFPNSLRMYDPTLAIH